MRTYFYYAHKEGGEAVIRIMAKRKPSAATIPAIGTWVARELIGNEWLMPSCPEITWGTLSKMVFLKREQIL